MLYLKHDDYQTLLGNTYSQLTSAKLVKMFKELQFWI